MMMLSNGKETTDEMFSHFECGRTDSMYGFTQQHTVQTTRHCMKCLPLCWLQWWLDLYTVTQ